MNHSYINEVIKDIQDISYQVEHDFGKISIEQLNWKPGPYQWSIGQCLDHLMTTNRTYYPVFQNIIKGQYRPSLWQRMPVIPGILGKMIINASRPEYEKKSKTFSIFEPAPEPLTGRVLQDFQSHQSELIDFFTQLDQIENHARVISSPASRWIIYSLKDCLTLLAVHEKRHLKQALTVRRSVSFPAGK